MLRKSMLTVLIAAAMIMPLSAYIFAGTSNSPGAISAGKTLTADSRTAEMTQLWDQQQSLSDDWAKIEEHYNSLMMITDPTELKTEMAKHQEMMKSYNDKMMSYQDMWRRDMASNQPQGSRPLSTRSRTAVQPKKMDMPTNH